jgi:hypothetical protein
LNNHRNTTSLRRAKQPLDRKQLDKSRKQVTRLRESRFLDVQFLLHDLRLNKVKVACGLQRHVAQSKERLVCALEVLLRNQPAGRLGADPDEEDEGDGGDEGGAELETPGDGAGVGNSEVGAGALLFLACGLSIMSSHCFILRGF